MKDKFHLRLIQNDKVLYESPPEGDDVDLIKPTDCQSIAEDFVKAINNLGLHIKAVLINKQ